MFLYHFITFFLQKVRSWSVRSGPGPLGPVRKILVVRSGPEGPQFARSVGTLLAAAQLTFSVTVTLRRLRVEKPEEQSVSVGELGQECVSSRVC